MIERGQILGAIIAGGEAKRMDGANKPLMLVGGKPLLVHAFERLKPQVGSIIINANRDLDLISATVPKNVAIVGDHTQYAGRGPLAGLLACLSQARLMNIAYTATTAADTPFFPEDVVDLLRAHKGEETIRIAHHGGFRHPLFALWPTALVDALEAFLKEEQTNKVMAFAQRHAVVDIEIQATGDPFFNVNKQQDLARANEMLQEMQA